VLFHVIAKHRLEKALNEVKKTWMQELRLGRDTTKGLVSRLLTKMKYWQWSDDLRFLYLFEPVVIVFVFGQ